MQATDMSEALKMIMADQGWSQVRLARELGRDQPWVSRVVRGHKDPKTREAAKLLAKVGWKLRITRESDKGGVEDDPVKRREFVLGTASAFFIQSPKTTPFHNPNYVELLTRRFADTHYYQGDNDAQVITLIDHAQKIQSALADGGRDLQLAAADFLRYGSYALHGAGRADIATRFAKDAIHLARRAEDPDKQAQGYFALGVAGVFNGYKSSVSASSKTVNRAVEVAQRGLRIPGIGDEPHAWLNSLLACGLANVPGHERQARAAIDQALSIDTIPAVDQAGIMGTVGNAIRDIGARHDALKMLEEAARLNAPYSPYLQARYLTDRITLALDVREPSLAVSDMNTLSCLLPLVGSTRLDRQVRRVLADARPWTTVSEVRDARERLQSVLVDPVGQNKAP